MKTNESGIIRRLSVIGALFLLVIFVGGCSQNAGPTDSSMGQTPDVLSKGRIIHHVSVGGPDFTTPGVDANFSLVANMDESGNVSGQWEDTFGNQVGKIHVAVDCMIISGNTAIIGGVIVHGSTNGVDRTGERAVTKVVDNGKSANDPPDQISYSFFGGIGTCGIYTAAVFPLFDMPWGQVTIK